MNSTTTIYKTFNTVDVLSLREFYFGIENKIRWQEYVNQGKQSGLQFAGDEDPFFSAVGVARTRDIVFTNLNPLYKDTVIEDIIRTYDCTRLRWMWMYPKTCYSFHKDQTPRIHIPLITSPENMFVMQDHAAFHLPTGHAYWVDTRLRHTFINCSSEPRLHLVGVVKS